MVDKNKMVDKKVDNNYNLYRNKMVVNKNKMVDTRQVQDIGTKQKRVDKHRMLDNTS